MRSGREFTRADDENAPPVAIVNQTMAARYWRGQDPIDRRFQVNGRWVRVVGVAADSKYESMRETAKPFFYVPLLQDFAVAPALNIRTTQPLQSISSAVLREVHALDRNLALYEVITLQEQVNRSTSPQLVAVTLVSILGGLALLLAAVGLYGVMSYAVAQANRELGLRLALGAGASNLFRLVISRGLRLTAAGVLCRRRRRARTHAIIRKASLQRQSQRPARLRIGNSGDDDHRSRSVSSPRLARDAHRSRARVAGMIVPCGN